MSLLRATVRVGLVLTCAAGLCGGTTLLAQATTGTLTGQVTASDGAGMPGVTVTVTSGALPGERVAVSDEKGYYILRGLPPGEYQTTFTQAGSQPVTSTASIRAGRVTSSDVWMNPASVSEPITVRGGTFGQLTGAQAQKLPIPSGNRFVTVPFISSASVQTARSPGQLGISGGLTWDNLFLRNGASVGDNLFGSANQLFIEDAIDSTETIPRGLTAEFGRFSGGVVNMITKSGGNEFSGSIRAEVFDSTFTSGRQNFDTPESSSQVYEATLGGPFWKDRLWFFAGGRRDQFKDTGTLFPLGPSVTGLTAPRESDDNRFEGKLTLTPSPGHSLIGSYIRLDRDETGVLPLPSAALPNTLLTPELSNSLSVAQYNGVISSSLFLELMYSRKAFTLSRAGGTSTDITQSPFFTPSGISVNGAPRNGRVPTERNNENVLATGSWFLATEGFGTHDISFGYDTFEDLRRENSALSSTGVAFLNNFQTNPQGTILLDSGGRAVPLWEPFNTQALLFPVQDAAEFKATTSSYYVNDSWQLNEKWSFNLGARYDTMETETNGTPSVDSTAITPRVGITYDLKGEGNWVFNASYGEYVASLNSRQFSSGIFGDRVIYALYRGPAGTGFSFAPGYNQNNYLPYFVIDTPAFTKTDPDLKPPSTRELSLGSFYNSRIFQASAFFTRRTVTDLVEDLRPSGPPTTLSITGVPPVAVDTIRIANSSTATREYRALDLDINLRPWDRFFFTASYTFSDLTGNYGGVLGGGTPNTSANGDYPVIFPESRYYPTTPIDNEQQRHRLRLIFVGTLPLGPGSLDLGATARAESGREVLLQIQSPLSSIQKAQATAAGYLSYPGSQALYFDGATTHFDGIRSLDLSATFTLGTGTGKGLFFKADAFNVFNFSGLEAFDTTILPGGPNDSLGQPTTFTRGPKFGTARAFDDFQRPREFRFSAGFRF